MNNAPSSDQIACDIAVLQTCVDFYNSQAGGQLFQDGAFMFQTPSRPRWGAPRTVEAATSPNSGSRPPCEQSGTSAEGGSSTSPTPTWAQRPRRLGLGRRPGRGGQHRGRRRRRRGRGRHVGAARPRGKTPFDKWLFTHHSFNSSSSPGRETRPRTPPAQRGRAARRQHARRWPRRRPAGPPARRRSERC